MSLLFEKVRLLSDYKNVYNDRSGTPFWQTVNSGIFLLKKEYR